MIPTFKIGQERLVNLLRSKNFTHDVKVKFIDFEVLLLLRNQVYNYKFGKLRKLETYKSGRT